MRNFIDFKDSIEIIKNLDIKLTKTENKPLSEALNYYIAQDIVANSNSPEYPTSAMDGYAIKYKDIDKKLKIIGINPAGSEANSLEDGCAIKTFTGSIMPKGADTLVPIESIIEEDGYITIKEKVDKNFSVRDIGENYKKGEILIKKGSKISFSEIGVLASLNYAVVKVYSKIKVAILSSGSEIVDIAQEKTKNQIRSSNHYTIEAIAKNYNTDTIQLGVVKDDINLLTDEIINGLNQADIVVTTGGVSVGDFDFVQDVIKDRLKAKVLFHGVKIKPGQHILLAQKDNKLILALPGFAYSSSVTALIYLKLLINKLYNKKVSLDIKKAILKHNLKNPAKKTSFIVADLEYKDNNYYVDSSSNKTGTSAILTNMIGKNALIMLDKEIQYKNKDDFVDIITI